MSTFKRGTYYHYDFEFAGERYRGTTKQRTKKAADKAVAKLQERLEQEAAGIAVVTADESPRFQDWANVLLAHARKTMKRPGRVESLLTCVLRFWGAKPKPKAAHPKSPHRHTTRSILKSRHNTPYHDLRLADPIRDPAWIDRFEEWLVDLGLAEWTKNQYRSTVSQMFVLARRPKNRKVTGITSNPIDGVERKKGRRSTVTLTVDQARATLAAASYHVRLAVAIGALAPKLRRSNVLALEWATHIDAGLQYITVTEHKTAADTQRALAIPITEQLRTILVNARARHPRATHVVTYQGKPVKDIRGGVKAAMQRAGVPYGRMTGATFHTIRHTAATMLAELESDPRKRQHAMGHEDLATTMWYEHLRPVIERPVLEGLSAALPIADLVMRPQRHGTVGTFVGTSKPSPQNDPINTGTLSNASDDAQILVTH